MQRLIGKRRCGKGFGISNCECEYDKSCDVGEYLDYQICKCRKKFVDKLVEECSENVDENKIIYNDILNDYENVCNSCMVYIVLLAVFLFIFIGT